MKPPKNFYNAVDRRKLDISDNLLPDVTTSDAGKVLKVSEAGAWQLADDENTIIEANPDEQPTVDLENLKIGDTVYSVKNPELTSIKSFKLTMSNGGQYNTNKPIIEFYDEGGQKAAITSSDYTVECDKTYAGNAWMDQVCSIQTPDTPGTFTYTFVNDFDIEEYKFIKLTRGGTFLNDIAKNIKLELSADGENYLTIYDETTITWSDAVPYHLISLKDGSEASTLLPIVTSSDNGKVLGVVNGVWDKKEITSPVPAASTSDNYSKLVIKNGAYTKMYDNLRLTVTLTENSGVYSGNYQIRTENGGALNNSISIMDICMFMILFYLPSGDTHGNSLSLTAISYANKNSYGIRDMLKQISFTDANGAYCHFTDVTVTDTTLSFKIAT